MVSKGTCNISLKVLYAKYSQADIASFYLHIKELPTVISSPLRQDRHPSMAFTTTASGDIVWQDFATGEKGNLMGLLLQMYKRKLPELISMIIQDMDTNYASSYNKRLSVKVRQKSSFTLKSVARAWEPYDFEYWQSYGIPKNWLLKADIYPISFFMIVSIDGITTLFKADKYAYTFIERKDGIVTEKIYQPFNKNGMKWRSSHDKSVWDLWTKLPKKGDKIIITSSRKDALCIWANTGIPATCPQSENTELKKHVVEQLKARFKEVFVLYDNDFKNADNIGRIDGKRLADSCGLKQIEIPEGLQSKDPSDLYKNHGKEVLVKTIKTLTL